MFASVCVSFCLFVLTLSFARAGGRLRGWHRATADNVRADGRFDHANARLENSMVLRAGQLG